MFLFRQRYNIGAYDPTPEDKLDEFIRSETPFDNWKEFLTAAYEHQAAPDEIAALLEPRVPTRVGSCIRDSPPYEGGVSALG